MSGYVNRDKDLLSCVLFLLNLLLNALIFSSDNLQ